MPNWALITLIVASKLENGSQPGAHPNADVTEIEVAKVRTCGEEHVPSTTQPARSVEDIEHHHEQAEEQQ
jgi:hypothetical protein